MLTGLEICNNALVRTCSSPWLRQTKLSISRGRGGRKLGPGKLKWISSLLITCLSLSINRPPSPMGLPLKRQPQLRVVPVPGSALGGLWSSWITPPPPPRVFIYLARWLLAFCFLRFVSFPSYNCVSECLSKPGAAFYHSSYRTPFSDLNQISCERQKQHLNKSVRDTSLAFSWNMWQQR